MLGTFVGGTMGRGPSGESLFSFDIFDADTAQLVDRVPMSFLGHGVAFRPNRRRHVAVFEKRGPGGALLDWVSAEKIVDIVPSPGRSFYGHAAYAKDGALLYVVETDLSSRQGVITVRDGDSFSILGEMPTFGMSPHDCVPLREGKVLAVTNAGGHIDNEEQASLVLVDVESRTLLEKFSLDREINAGHVAIQEDGSFAICSAPRPGLPEESSVGGISLRKAGGSVHRLEAPPSLVNRLLGESLSVTLEGNAVLVTTPLANVVTQWSLSDESLAHEYALEFPRGVCRTKTPDRFLVTYGKVVPKIALIDAAARVVVQSELGSKVFSGSHLFLAEE